MSHLEDLNNRASNLEQKTKQWQDKITELTVPDHYGYNGIDEKIKETVAALQLLGINTYQSCEGHHSERPWIEFHAKYPKNVYVGEEELKKQLMVDRNIFPEEIDESSSVFDRAKQVDIEGDARDQLVKKSAAYTPEFEEWRIKTRELIEKLQGIIDDFYIVQPVSNDVRVIIDFPYRFPQYTESIHDVPFLETRSSENLSEENHERILLQNQEEMKRFTKYLKERFFAQ